MLRTGEEQNVIEGQGLVLLEYSLDIRKSGCAVGVPAETQLDIFSSRFAGLKDVEPGAWICGRLLFLQQVVTDFLSRIGCESGIAGFQRAIRRSECPR